MEQIRREREAICSAFKKNPDGSWTCIKSLKVDVLGVEVEIEEGTTFKRREKFQDVDVVEWLDEVCKPMTFGPI